MMMILVSTMVAQGQIKIGGNVYGGGNEGYVQGNTTVTVLKGDIGARADNSAAAADLPTGKVFGGARMANVGGNTFVHIDGVHASGDMVINQVYGGNDIAGVVGVNPDAAKRLPAELADAAANEVDNSWNSFVRVSQASKVKYTQEEINAAQDGDPAHGKTTDDYKNAKCDIFIGQLYGGGNGDYEYSEGEKIGDNVTHYIYSYNRQREADKLIASKTTSEGEAGFVVPELAKSFIDIHGGTIADAYGGGNNATVTEKAVICVDNQSAVVTQVTRKDGAGQTEELLTSIRLKEMGLSVLSDPGSDEFQIGSLFGGNNRADMAIRPSWHLQDGQIRHLYSGGNRGRMIYENGLFLEIPTSSKVVVDNLYGGCRMADVRPMKKDASGEYNDVTRVSSNDIKEKYGYNFPPDLAARVIVAGGDVNNVYGGNDVRGSVYFGNAVGIMTSVRGDVYGGGNGAYAYTDYPDYQYDDVYGDYYYDGTTGSIDALNALRPNAEQVSIHVRGTESKPTIIKGSIYLGGNCATLKKAENRPNPLVELKIGSHVIAENVYLGNNGEKMVSKDILQYYSEDEGFSSYSTLRFDSDPTDFANYMKGVTLDMKPALEVEDDYQPYTSYIGSLFYGGNRGSMTYEGTLNITPNAPVYIYNKLVAGCNNANVAKSKYNARYEGGILGSEEETNYTGDRIVMNLSKIRLKPMRLNSEGTGLEWNTVFKDYEAVADGTTLAAGNTYYTSASGDGGFSAVGTEVADGSNYYMKTNGWVKTDTGTGAGTAKDDDMIRRLYGGNIFGGCNESGHVNGNVVINLNGSLLNRHDVFAQFTPKAGDVDEILYDYEQNDYIITERNSGVILNEQGMDVEGEALTVFGGGKGKETEIWGSTTVNIKEGYVFQVFGGSDEGAIGKGTWDEDLKKYKYGTVANEAYSCYVNFNGEDAGTVRKRSGSEGTSTTEAFPDVEFIYGGGFSGIVMGNTNVHLDNGRLFNLFAGSCNADILGHTETYVGLNGYPYLRDHIYGGNDLGGEIKGKKDYTYITGHVSSDDILDMVHAKDADPEDGVKDVLQANAYIEYRRGRMKNIFGGCFGDYDYEVEFSADQGYDIPKLDNAFVNFRPDDSDEDHVNHVDKIFGAGEGYAGERYGDKMQNRSYVLVDIAADNERYKNTEVFGGGQNNGLGMAFTATETFGKSFNADKASAIIDLARGKVLAAYGGSFSEGVTRRTLVNVPEGSTIKIGSIFGGAYGSDTYTPCDVYEANVNYHSGDACLIYDASEKDEKGNLLWKGAIYGGNNRERRTLYSKINIDVPVRQKHPIFGMTTATVYGAGFGSLTWNEYTEVNLNDEASVWEVYGGGQAGGVMSAESVQAYIATNPDDIDPKKWKAAWSLGSDYDATTFTGEQGYAANTYTNLENPLVRKAEIDDRAHVTSDSPNYKKYNTNVIIHEGAYVGNYAYGGGLGLEGDAYYGSGDVYGSTYIALLGGTVNRDLYAAGTSGSVYDLFKANATFSNFKATCNAYIQGGTVRNVYGGGWKGGVGYHAGDITAATTDDVPGETHVVIGDVDGNSFTNGIPAIKRNAYGGGEGGAVYGTAHITLNNGYVGYEYQDGGYVPKIEDDTKPTPNTLLTKAGCLFGGGYVDNSSVDKTIVKIYGGTVRNSAFGGGEVAAIGRGTITVDSKGEKVLEDIYRAGKAHLEMYGGHVLRNVFGGGRGYNNLDEHGTLDSDGFVFGQTEVHIHGGEIGTDIVTEDGNVFGGGDVGYVYSAFEKPDGTVARGEKSGVRYDGSGEGYYYYNGSLTEDCKVLIEPHAKVTDASGIPLTNIVYPMGTTIPDIDLIYLKENGVTTGYDGNGVVTADAGVTIASRTYAKGEYVPTYALNTLKNKNTSSEAWEKLDLFGIIIHNAVFAGGNTSAGSSDINNAHHNNYANNPSVFGNATASIHDVYNRDLITLGTRHTGGLYGDGNLTLVDGYRELNITNYGTDFYSIAKEIDTKTYHNLPDREAAYYELRYMCIKECVDNDGTHYKPASTESGKEIKASVITADDYFTVFKDCKYDGDDMIVTDPNDPDNIKQIPNPDYWKENGVLPVYAGRLMNSIQRADFCGVWGSRMVMQGAEDRVQDKADYINYTINRVREVSLNKKDSKAGDPPTITVDNQTVPNPNYQHGNYFGIYNIVNYLGALTSDVTFDAKRETDNVESNYSPDREGQTFYEWKDAHKSERKRNNGKSHNKVALASGVYLELTTEKSTGTGLYEKAWGPVTGIIELDLINVQPGMGGGFVYAKNVHGERTATNATNTTLTTLNSGAATKADYTYTDPESSQNTQQEIETSGNFVHSSQTIIDDCYNISAKYKGAVNPDGSGAMPAHYWYIKGEVYVYDQYISAYTGIPNAYSKAVEIPLTITAASHGSMKLLNVQPNYYAYYASNGVKLTDDQKIIINDKTYYRNDPISFWDWYQLSRSERNLFVPMTYVNCVPVRIDGGELYPAGSYVMTADEFSAFGSHTYTNADGDLIKDGDKNNATTEYIFRKSNSVSHDKGYILTYQVNNPGMWNTWYSPKSGSSTDGKINSKAFGEKDASEQSNFEDGPTYRLIGTAGQVLGQHDYKEGDVISEDVKTTYDAITSKPTTGQATFERAWIVTQQVTVTDDDGTHHQHVGSRISDTEAKKSDYAGKVAEAFICTSTIELSETEMILVNTTMTEAEKTAYYDRFNKEGATDREKRIAKEISDNIVPAYYCTVEGKYGGNFYEIGKNYRGLEAWSSMSETDRQAFTFNYDALDLLVDPTYTNLNPTLVANKYQYDSSTATKDAALTNKAGYSLPRAIDYTATYNGTDTGPYNGVALLHGKEYDREDYEKLPNEQRHYTVIKVKEGKKGDDGKYTVYVAHQSFEVGNSAYAVGTVVDAQTYSGLPEDAKSSITALTFDDPKDNDDGQLYYYCRESYKVGYNGNGVAVTNLKGTAGYDNEGNSVTIKTGEYGTDDVVPIGVVIGHAKYTDLVTNNKQKDFTIHGISPTELSTLYVSRESDIYDLSKEKIITVVYQYDYDEVTTSGTVTPVSERHVVNIHLQFKSGAPIVGEITKPDIILPGEFISMMAPSVTPGAYEITSRGWELFETPKDADSHSNGIDCNLLTDPLYWYQNDWYIAYYANTYLGRTYSNAVPVRVANYHDLADVMSDANKAHHMFIDNADVKREPKIYINDYTATSQNGLDLLKSLFDLSVLDNYTVDPETGLISGGTFAGHKPLDNIVRGGDNLEFFLRTDISHADDPTVPDEWTPIANGSECFEGTLHGDGHTISGLDNSLFGSLCGSVYNLGVMGSFNTAGVVDRGNGYVESCWVKTSATTPVTGDKPYAVFGNPSFESGYQLVNSYFWKGNKTLYNIAGDDPAVDDDAETITSGGERGKATAMSSRAFYNGELAYDLNNFYLYKRYINQTGTANEQTLDGRYYTVGSDNKLTLQPYKTYESQPAFCSTGFTDTEGTIKYVEDRFADGDFRYAAGEIPENEDERCYTEEVKDPDTGEVTSTISHFYPIWPDDYLFFGQALNYGHEEGLTHQDTPSSINRNNGRVVKEKSVVNADGQAVPGNRVYRAPAYFRSGVMDVAHFNPYAIFAQTKKDDETVIAHKNMTAIDFTGSNGDVAGGYHVGTNNGRFYPPLLDDDGLTGFSNIDLTQNLLAYTEDPGNNQTAAEKKKTASVVSTSLYDPAFTKTNDKYKTVAIQSADRIKGHWVKKTTGGSFEATLDHFLVDKQDFNAPIAYTFGAGKRMWYQREPEDHEFVDRTKGWQGISLPFTAELVTTQEKGEITHFYSGSLESKNDTHTKIGHEYWLRQLTGDELTADANNGHVLVADFQYPTGQDSDDDKTVTNTFLWDFYYNGLPGGHNHLDRNEDTYQTYYNSERTYGDYPLLTKGTPYLLGLPGVTYYEFDLSGNFESGTTDNRPQENINSPENLKTIHKQVITFASMQKATIGVSDDEKRGKVVSYNGSYYTFKPSYLNETLGNGDFVMNRDGNAYVKLTEDASQSAFRPYFISTGNVPSPTRSVEQIVFGQSDLQQGVEEEHGDPTKEELNGGLRIWTKKDKIFVESSLKFTADMRVVTPAGVTVASFSVMPGKTVEVQADFSGMYIVHTLDGKYTKKVTVRK